MVVSFYGAEVLVTASINFMEGAVVGLFVNNVVLTRATVYADLNTPVNVDPNELPMPAWDSILQDDGSGWASVKWGQIIFQANSDSTFQRAFGYFVKANDKLIWAEKFNTPPPLSVAGQQVAVRPRLRGRSLLPV